MIMKGPTDNELRQEIASLRAEIAACWMNGKRGRARILNDRLEKAECEARHRASMAHEFGGLCDVTG